MKKPAFELNRQQLEGLSSLIDNYLAARKYTGVQGAWLRATLIDLMWKFDRKATALREEQRRTCKMSLTAAHCFAFSLLFHQHPIATSSYIDVTVMQMLHSIDKFYTS